MAVLFAVLLLPGCAGPEPAPAAVPADVVFVTIDTLRADRVGAYGDPLAQTPTLDAVAASGVLFREAIAGAPTTLPAHVAMLTGRLPREHGARDNAGGRVDPALTTVAEALGQAGFHTGAFTSAAVLDASTGIDQGFVTFDAPLEEARGSGGAAERAGAETVARALAWWRETPAPRFLWVHLYEPHRPWPEVAGDPYRADVAAADAALGVLLDGLGARERAGTWPFHLVVAADHGESLWEHGERDHGLLTSRAALHVPLLVRTRQPIPPEPAPSPRSPPVLDVQRPADLDLGLVLEPVPDAPRAARVDDRVARGVDVAATLAALAGVKLEGEGRDLRGPLSEPVAYAETWYPATSFGWAPRCAVVQGGRWWSGRTTGQTWGVDDPGQVRPGPDDPTLAALAAERGCLDEPTAGEADPRLVALGYLTGAGDLPEGDMAAVNALLRAEEERDPAKARVVYEALLARYPRLWRARSGLAVALAGLGDPTGALAQLDTPGMPETLAGHGERAALQLALGDTEGALRTAERMRVIAPKSPLGWRLEAAVHLRRQEGDATERAARLGLEVAPEDPPLLFALGVALAARRADTEALATFEHARRAGATNADLDLQVALVHDRAGRHDEAAAAYAAYRAKAPDDLRGWAAPAWMFAHAGRCAEALPLAEHALILADDPRMRKVVEECR